MCWCRLSLGRRAAVRLFAGGAALPFLAGCDDAGGLPVNLVSEAEVRALGLETWRRIVSSTPESTDPGKRAMPRDLAARLLVAAGEDAARWDVRLFARPDVNAFAQYANEIAGLLGAGVEFGLLLPYSRRQELQADKLGLFTMARALRPRAGDRALATHGGGGPAQRPDVPRHPPGAGAAHPGDGAAASAAAGGHRHLKRSGVSIEDSAEEYLAMSGYLC